MPLVFRFYLKHCLIGYGVSAVFVAALLYFNIANLAHLILGSDVGMMALFLLWFFNGSVFAGVQTGVAVMMMAEDGQGGGPRGNAPATPTSARDLVPVKAPAR